MASRLLIPMDEGQSNHLKAYGVALLQNPEGNTIGFKMKATP